MCHYSINGNVTEGMCDIISDQSTEGNFSFVEQHLIDGQMPKNQFEVLLTDVVVAGKVRAALVED